MALPDLTGQNIQDTYQRLLQVSGTLQVTDGTGSMIPLLEVTASHAVSASHEITFELSSSHADSADSADSLTTGIDISVRHVTASGNISASGNLTLSSSIYFGSSASIDFGSFLTIGKQSSFGNEYIKIGNDKIRLLTNDNDSALEIDDGNAQILMGYAGIDSVYIGSGATQLYQAAISQELNIFKYKAKFGPNGTISGMPNNSTVTISGSGTDIGNALEIFGHTTASGDISASGTVFAKDILIPSNGAVYFDNEVAGSDPQKIEGTDNYITINADNILNLSADEKIDIKGPTAAISMSIDTVSGHITASGNISSSGEIKGATGLIMGQFVAVGNTFVGEHNGGNLLTIDRKSDAEPFARIDCGSDDFGVDVGFAIRTRNAGSPATTFEIDGVGNITASGNISSSGKIVGSKLFIDATDAGGIIFDDDGDQIAEGSLTFINNGVNIFAHSANPSTATHLYVTQSGGTGMGFGKVGINTLTPTKELEVVGDISSSGDVYADNYFVNNVSSLDNNATELRLGYNTNHTKISLGRTGTTTQVAIIGNITASGDISSSGDILASFYKSQGTNAIGFSTDSIKVSEDYPIILNHSSTTAGNITASGDISASGAISSSLGFFTPGIVKAEQITSTDDITATDDISAGGNMEAGAAGNFGFAGSLQLARVNSSTELYIGVSNNWTKFQIGKNSDQPVTFIGNITASQNISASRGSIISSGTGSFHYLRGDTTAAGTGLTVQGFIEGINITGSNISASGTTNSQLYHINGKSLALDSTNNLRIGEATFDSIDINNSDVAIGGATGDIRLRHVTASGQISASSHIYGLTHYGSGFQPLPGNSTLAIGSISTGTQDFTITVGHHTNSAPITIHSDITASGDIKAGGEISASAFLDGNRKFTSAPTGIDSAGPKGDIVYFGGGTVAQGRVYYWNSSGNWTIADHESAADATGFMAYALGDSISAGMLIRGFVLTSGDQGDPGSPLYLGQSSGTMTTTAPTAAGTFVRIMGYCLDNTSTIWFDPDKTWVELK